jgi:hypothetical protein
MDNADDPAATPFYSGSSSTLARRARNIKVALEKAELVEVEQKKSRRGNPRAWNSPAPRLSSETARAITEREVW